MKFGKTTKEKKTELIAKLRARQSKTVFTWLPTQLSNGQYVWLEYVEKKPARHGPYELQYWNYTLPKKYDSRGY